MELLALYLIGVFFFENNISSELMSSLIFIVLQLGFVLDISSGFTSFISTNKNSEDYSWKQAPGIF
jgi:hypothetical protein